jgi:hypothetical protein
MTDKLEQISALLHEASETHHRVFRIVDGADDDWASWYAFRMSRPWSQGPGMSRTHSFGKINSFIPNGGRRNAARLRSIVSR